MFIANRMISWSVASLREFVIFHFRWYSKLVFGKIGLSVIIQGLVWRVHCIEFIDPRWTLQTVHHFARPIYLTTHHLSHTFNQNRTKRLYEIILLRYACVFNVGTTGPHGYLPSICPNRANNIMKPKDNIA